MLEMNHITKKFPGVKALDDVTLKAEPGRVLALIGINGAGKSTLMNVLGGILKPDEGDILIEGGRVSFGSPKDAENNGVAFIHQEPLFFASMSVAQNIFISRLHTGAVPGFVDSGKMSAEAKEKLGLLGADDIDPRTKMEDITIGARQMVEIARALAAGANIIIFDEPTSSLSLHEKNKLFGVIRRLRDEGKTVIYISHFLDEIIELCDDYLVLRDGRMSGSGLVKDVDKSDLVRMIIGGELERIDKGCAAENRGEVVLSVEDFRRGNLLRGASFELRRGEVLGLWGLMGSGRTELVRAMFGLDRVDGGSVRYAEGGALAPIKKADLLARCGYVTENRHADGLFLPMSLWENVTSATLPAYASRGFGFMNAKKEVADCEAYIKKLSIRAPSAHTKAMQLSGGNQQKVIFSKWMNKNADVLVLDEPTRGVDVGSKLEIHKIIRGLAAEGTAVLLISSEVDEMVDLSDRVIVLQEGRIIETVEGEGISQGNLMALALGERRREA